MKVKSEFKDLGVMSPDLVGKSGPENVSRIHCSVLVIRAELQL